VDDTVVAQPAARLLGEAAWVWSNKERKGLFGVSVVLLVWPDGQPRVPLGFRVWHKGGISKYELALELLSYARHRLKCQPAFVLFDSWYPSHKLLKRIRDDGWYVVCPLKKHRSFNGRPVRAHLPQPSWQAVGTLSGGLKVLVVRDHRKSSATNRLPLTAPEGRTLSRKRHEVEAVMRLLKSPRGLVGCQGGYKRGMTGQPYPQTARTRLRWPYVWWHILLWNVNALLSIAPGVRSSAVSSSGALVCRCQHWSGSERLRNF
jgi:hypothetical protein